MVTTNPRWVVAIQPDLERLLFASSLVSIGSFRADPRHPRFRDTGPIPDPVFAFPRRSVRIQHAGGPAFVASANVVTYYNAGQIYRREAVDPDGDRSDWFSLRPDVLVEVLNEIDPSVVDRPDRPFPFAVGPGDPGCYVRQRALVHYVTGAGERADSLAVEETAMGLLLDVAGLALQADSHRRPLTTGHRDLVERLKVLLARRLHEALTLADLASELRCSPFYLARLFRAAEGTSIHRYRLRLRLTRSLEPLALGRSVGALATELGFASNSHFTEAFRRTFGITPSRFRSHANGRAVRDLFALATGSRPPAAAARPVVPPRPGGR